MKKFISLSIALLCISGLFAQTWQVVGTGGFSPGGVVYNTATAFDRSGTPYVAFQDAGNNNAATVMKFNGSSWVRVGNAGFSSANIGLIAIAMDNTDKPYVFYTENTSGQGTVMKFNGSSWVPVGTSMFTPSSALWPAIAINQNNVPYVAYQDFQNDRKLTVMKFDGSNWVPVGTAGFTGNIVQWVSIAIDRNNTPYVAYQDGTGSSAGASVRKFNGTSWVLVGSQGFTPSPASYVSLITDNANDLWLGCAAGSAGSSTPALYKWNGSNWTQTGNFTDCSQCWYPGFAIDGSGTPHVVYKDASGGTNDHYASAKYYDGTTWQQEGNTRFSGTMIKILSGSSRSHLSMGVDNLNTPYAVFADFNFGNRVTVMKLNGSANPPNVSVNNQQAATRSLSAGDSAVFRVTGYGAGVTYQWRRNGIDISGATSAVYRIASVSPADQGTYTVVIRNAVGTITSSPVTLLITLQSVNNNSLSAASLLYPNPTRNEITVQLRHKPAADISIRIINMAGEVLYENTHTFIGEERSCTIKTSEYPKGAYLLQLSDNDNMVTKIFSIE